MEGSTGHGSDELLGKKSQSGVTAVHKGGTAGQRHIKQHTSIFGPTSKQGWHFKTFMGHPRCTQRSNRWTRLAEGGTANFGAAGKEIVAFAQGRMLHVGKELMFCTNVTKNETSQ